MLNDMDFIKTCDVPGPTKEAIRAIILYKSAVTPNDEVVDGVSERGGFPVVQKKMRQWCLRVSATHNGCWTDWTLWTGLIH